MKHVRKRLSYANVVSSIALFLALGGAAAVASSHLLPANSVGSRQLQPNAVKTGYIDRNAVRVGKIAPEAVRAGRLAKDAVPTDRLRNGAVTAVKLRNQAVTAPKLGPVTTVEQEFVIASGAALTNATVACPAGSVALGGGVQVNGEQTAIQQSLKFENGWRGGARNDDAEQRTLTVQAHCLGA